MNALLASFELDDSTFELVHPGQNRRHEGSVRKRTRLLLGRQEVISEGRGYRPLVEIERIEERSVVIGHGVKVAEVRRG